MDIGRIVVLAHILMFETGRFSLAVPEHPGHQRLTRISSAEKNLTSSLLRDYDYWGVIGRPVQHSRDVLRVQLSLALIQILDLDENKQMLRSNCWLRFAWNDSLLSWENWTQPEFKEIGDIRVLPSQIWTPDIKLYNFADDRLEERRETRVVVHRSGKIQWIPQSILKSSCKVEISDFPFDTQRCVIRFGSWTYDESQLMLDWGFNADLNKFVPFVDFSDYVTSNEWQTDGESEVDVVDPDKKRLQIRSVMTYRNETSYDKWGRRVDKRYRILEYRIRLMRNPNFYFAIVIVPCILLSVLTLVLFWLPPESPAKMLLGMNIFVAFFILLLLLAELIPSAVQTFPLIGVYYSLNMVLITLSTFFCSIVVNLHFYGDQSGPMRPIWRRFFIDGLGTLFLVRQSIPLPADRRSIFKKRECGEDTIPLKPKKFSLSANAGRMKCRRFRITELNHTGSIDEQDSSLRRAVYSEKTSGFQLPCAPEVEENLREITLCIRMIIGKKKDADRKNLISMEWRTLALVLDRLFFLLYALAIFSAIIAVLPRRQETVLEPP